MLSSVTIPVIDTPSSKNFAHPSPWNTPTLTPVIPNAETDTKLPSLSKTSSRTETFPAPMDERSAEAEWSMT